MNSFIISQEGLNTLKYFFNRDVAKHHEYEKESTSQKYDSFSLGYEFCRRPHHPPSTYMKLQKNLPEISTYLLIIQEDSKTKSGRKSTQLLVYPATNPEATFEVACISGSCHETASSSYTSVKTEAIFVRKYHTGGTGHGRPFWVIIDKKIMGEIAYGYHSYRGAISIDKVVPFEKGGYIVSGKSFRKI